MVQSPPPPFNWPVLPAGMQFSTIKTISPIVRPSPPQPVADTDPELYVGRLLRGYRAWTADWAGDTPVLRPIHRARLTPWEPGLNTAVCILGCNGENACNHSPQHAAPFPKCSCGFWAYFTATGYDRTNLQMNPYSCTLVTGVIRAEGKVQLTETGFRAAKAEVLAIAPPREIHQTLQDVLDVNKRAHALFDLDLLRSQFDHVGYCPCLWCRRDRGVKTPPTLAQLASRYGVKAFDTFDALCEAYPPTDEPDPYCGDQSLYASGHRAQILQLQALRYSLTPYDRTPEPQARQIVDMIDRNWRQLFGRRRGDWSNQPAFTGSSGAVIKKWWRWALTWSASDVSE